jgi:hypothetical protein
MQRYGTLKMHAWASCSPQISQQLTASPVGPSQGVTDLVICPVISTHPSKAAEPLLPVCPIGACPLVTLSRVAARDWESTRAPLRRQTQAVYRVSDKSTG